MDNCNGIIRNRTWEVGKSRFCDAIVQCRENQAGRIAEIKNERKGERASITVVECTRRKMETQRQRRESNGEVWRRMERVEEDKIRSDPHKLNPILEPFSSSPSQPAQATSSPNSSSFQGSPGSNRPTMPLSLSNFASYAPKSTFSRLSHAE